MAMVLITDVNDINHTSLNQHYPTSLLLSLVKMPILNTNCSWLLSTGSWSTIKMLFMVYAVENYPARDSHITEYKHHENLIAN